MSNLYAQETWLEHNDDGHTYCLGESGVYETHTDNTGELFRAMQKEYGCCTGKYYSDLPSYAPIGWVFIKRQKYEDCDKTYLLETWVTVHNGPPEKKIIYDYHPLT